MKKIKQYLVEFTADGEGILLKFFLSDNIHRDFLQFSEFGVYENVRLRSITYLGEVDCD